MLHVLIGLAASPVILITFPWRIEFCVLRVEFIVGEFGLRRGGAVGRIERKRWRPTETPANERETRKHVGPDQRAQASHERALVVSHHHRGAAIAERRDKRDLVAQHIDSKKWKGICVPGIVPAGRAAKPTTIGGDRIVTCGGQGRHHLAPAVSEVGKTVQHEYQRSTRRLKARLQDVHRQTIDVRDEARPDAGGKRAVAIGRQVAEIRFCGRGPRRRGGSHCEAANTRGRCQKLAPRELRRGGII